MVHQRHPSVARTIIEAVEANDPAQTAQGVVSSINSLRSCGFRHPFLGRSDQGKIQSRFCGGRGPIPATFWTTEGCCFCRAQSLFLEEELRLLLDEPEEALLRSQGGPLASVPFTSLPTLRETTFAPQPFRLLLLRRLRLAVPLSARWCRCGRPLDCRGHHRSACARAGILGYRGYPMESVMARICREAGARVRTNVMVRDLDLGAFNHLDGRRLEIIADGLPLWRGAQLAIDTTLVSPIRADGTARRHAAHRDGVALEEARRTKERKYPELAGNGGRARLVVVAAEVEGRFSAEANQFLRGLVSAKVRDVPDILKGKAAAAWSRRWRSMLGCVVANSFALSLLGRVPPGADGEVPLLSDVLGADRHQ